MPRPIRLVFGVQRLTSVVCVLHDSHPIEEFMSQNPDEGVAQGKKLVVIVVESSTYIWIQLYPSSLILGNKFFSNSLYDPTLGSGVEIPTMTDQRMRTYQCSSTTRQRHNRTIRRGTDHGLRKSSTRHPG